MIRFSALLVAVAVGLLVAGVVTSKLVLVYVAIGVSGVALLALAVGALIKRKELFGPSTSASTGSTSIATVLPSVLCAAATSATSRPTSVRRKVVPGHRQRRRGDLRER